MLGFKLTNLSRWGPRCVINVNLSFLLNKLYSCVTWFFFAKFKKIVFCPCLFCARNVLNHTLQVCLHFVWLQSWYNVALFLFFSPYPSNYIWMRSIVVTCWHQVASSNLVITVSGNGLSPVWQQAITWGSTELLSIRHRNKFQWNLNQWIMISIQRKCVWKKCCHSV